MHFSRLPAFWKEQGRGASGGMEQPRTWDLQMQLVVGTFYEWICVWAVAQNQPLLLALRMMVKRIPALYLTLISHVP